MTTPSEPSAVATVQIDARPDEVYGLITDLPTLASLAEEAVAMQWRKGDCGSLRGRSSSDATETAVGAGPRSAPSPTPNRAAFSRLTCGTRSFPVARWQYDIVAADGGCRVTESTWDQRPGWFAKLAGLATGVPDRTSANAKHIQLTLQRLKQRAESG